MTLFDIPATTISGAAGTLAEHRGKVLLVVNVASKCGFTGQYAGLEELWKAYRERGLVVLGFPCDQFGHQEPGTEEQISQFCSVNFGVTFPLFKKVEVNGPNAHPLYTALKDAKPGLLGMKGIKWNFTKFLVDRGGKVVGRFGPMTGPKALKAKIEKLLGEPAT
jgi:glutathione peroxidase